MCSAAGRISDGGLCTDLLDGDKKVLSFEEFISFLEAQSNPERGAAMCMSSSDWGTMKTELEEACRLLGSRCSYELQTIIHNMSFELLKGITK